MKDIYSDGGVLKNKLNIKDSDALDKAEKDILCYKMFLANTEFKNISLDIDGLRKLNSFLFGDVYEWAGEFRTVPIWKEEKVFGYMDSVRYSTPDCIESDLKECFQYYNSLKWDTMPKEEKKHEIVNLLADIWKIHPFREGNTRTCVTFTCFFAEKIHVPMDKRIFAQNHTYMRDSLVYASDGQYAQKQYLQKIMFDSMNRGEMLKETLEESKKCPENIKGNEKTKRVTQNKKTNIDMER